MTKTGNGFRGGGVGAIGRLSLALCAGLSTDPAAVLGRSEATLMGMVRWIEILFYSSFFNGDYLYRQLAMQLGILVAC